MVLPDDHETPSGWERGALNNSNYVPSQYVGIYWYELNHIIHHSQHTDTITQSW